MPRVAIAVRDLDHTLSVFSDRFGMPVSELEGMGLGIRLAFVAVPGGAHIELMAPDDPGAPLSKSLQGFIDRRGEGLSALVLQSTDLVATRVALEKGGVTVAADGGDALEIAPADACGTPVRVELA